MKRNIALILAALLSCLPLSGCGDANTDTTTQVVCTIFPAYDWAKAIIGDTEGISLTLLADDGTDPHSFQPSVQDIAAVQKADVLCYVGGTSDTWVADAIDTASTQQETVILLEAADAQAEVTVAGMQIEEHDHEDADADHNHEAEEIDEHIWLSLEQASLVCDALRDALCAVAPEQADAFQENCAAYQAQLADLDAQYTALVEEEAVRDTILVADRFPYRYLAEDYDLTYYAAFPGCSAETEASFETVAFLAERLEALSLPCVLVTETSDRSIAKTVLENAGSDGEILVLDSIQSVTAAQLEDGDSYLGRMTENLAVLRQALT